MDDTLFESAKRHWTTEVYIVEVILLFHERVAYEAKTIPRYSTPPYVFGPDNPGFHRGDTNPQIFSRTGILPGNSFVVL